jgi:hypothetical protein
MSDLIIINYRRYRKKYENTEKIKELMSEQVSVVENLNTAIEGKMEIAVIGNLSNIYLIPIELNTLILILILRFFLRIHIHCKFTYNTVECVHN